MTTEAELDLGGLGVVELATELKSLLDQGLVADADKNFCESLARQGAKGSLSPKQRMWAERMVKKALGMGQPWPQKSEPEASHPDKGTPLPGVLALFDFAKGSKLKYPKIRLVTAGGIELRLHCAGAKSKYKGCVMVQTTHQNYYDRKLYGMIRDDTWLPYKMADATELQDVLQTLKLLSSNPKRAMQQYGKKTGNCGFCSLPLTDPKSVYVGYGPVCAEKWHLPWGALPEEEPKTIHG